MSTGLPSSEKATAPPSASSAISTSSAPFRPLETAPTGRTRTAADAARPMTKSRVARESMAGSVLGMQQMVVKPPLAAARAPVAMVSFSSNPGSRRWT